MLVPSRPFTFNVHYTLLYREDNFIAYPIVWIICRTGTYILMLSSKSPGLQAPHSTCTDQWRRMLQRHWLELNILLKCHAGACIVSGHIFWCLRQVAAPTEVYIGSEIKDCVQYLLRFILSGMVVISLLLSFERTLFLMNPITDLCWQTHVDYSLRVQFCFLSDILL